MSVPLDERAPSFPPPPPRRRRPVTPALALAAAAVLGVVALAVVLLAVGAFGGDGTTVVNQRISARAGAGTGIDAAAVYARANPGVVDITAHATKTVTPAPFDFPRAEQVTDTGTGMVIDGRGDILTADHVVAGASSITVTFQGGVTRTATVLGHDAGTDVAVLSVNPRGLTLHPLPLGSLAGLRVGDPVAVIGDPFDVQRSLSVGVISGLDRTIQAPNGFTIPHAVQTDAAMNPGNSGGPLLDASGRVIGIADQIDTGANGSDASAGVGFAVPIDIVRSELSRLEAGRTPAHAYLGVSTADATDAQGQPGALVASVAPKGPASRAGVRAGDLIVGLDKARITSVNALVAVTSRLAPGDRTTLTVIRGGRRLSLRITPAGQPRSIGVTAP